MDTIKFEQSTIKMVAHRGVSGLERENTCPAFVAAGNRSYYGVETDIHCTKDGKFIVYHDDHLKRLFDGDERIVEEMTLTELRQLCLKDFDGHVRGDLVLPTLEEYVRICKKYEKECVLEIKNHFEPAMLDRVFEILKQEEWLEHTIFISFDRPNMLYIREKLPEQRAQYLVSYFDKNVLDTLKENTLDLDIDYRNLTAHMVNLCHENGIVVNVWTVNTLEDAQRMAEYGVDFITTNILE